MIFSSSVLFPGPPAQHQPRTQGSAWETLKKRMGSQNTHSLTLGQEGTSVALRGQGKEITALSHRPQLLEQKRTDSEGGIFQSPCNTHFLGRSTHTDIRQYQTTSKEAFILYFSTNGLQVGKKRLIWPLQQAQDTRLMPRAKSSQRGSNIEKKKRIRKISSLEQGIDINKRLLNFNCHRN